MANDGPSTTPSPSATPRRRTLLYAADSTMEDRRDRTGSSTRSPWGQRVPDVCRPEPAAGVRRHTDPHDLGQASERHLRPQAAGNLGSSRAGAGQRGLCSDSCSTQRRRNTALFRGRSNYAWPKAKAPQPIDVEYVRPVALQHTPRRPKAPVAYGRMNRRLIARASPMPTATVCSSIPPRSISGRRGPGPRAIEPRPTGAAAV